MTDRIAPEALRFERQLDAPVDTVWRYLADSDLRARWFMAGPTDLREGGAFGLTMDHGQLSDEDVPIPERYRPAIGHSWSERITRCEPPHLLAFTWEGGQAGEVMFELTAAVGGTRLILTHSGLRGRDDAIDLGGGWHSHLAALEKRVRGEGVPDFWALHADAAAKIEAALR